VIDVVHVVDRYVVLKMMYSREQKEYLPELYDDLFLGVYYTTSFRLGV